MKKLGRKHKQWQKATESLSTADGANVLDQMAKIATLLGLKLLYGKIALLNRTKDGGYNVQLNVTNGFGYSSMWPEWAYEIARDGFLFKRIVWVLCDGDPLGQNLLEVMVVQDSY